MYLSENIWPGFGPLGAHFYILFLSAIFMYILLVIKPDSLCKTGKNVTLFGCGCSICKCNIGMKCFNWSWHLPCLANIA